MSKKEEQNKEGKQEKVMTKYDLKMQRREEEKRRAAQEKKIGNIVGILVLIGLVCLVASFPIRNYLTLNGTYIKVGGESVSKVEFDYNYNMVKNNYINQYSYYLSMFGMDLSGDLSKQMYSDTLTWQDFFEEMAVDNIVNNKAMKKQAEAEGFSYDATADFETFKTNLKKSASDAGMTEKAYLQKAYGSYATLSRIKDYVMENQELGKFYQSVQEKKAPSEQDIQDYYDENKDEYDSVDYRMETVNAELPDAPTELADPVEETADGEEAEEDAEYVPSDAEVAAAMAEAKTKADEMLETIATEGTHYENKQSSSINSTVSDWLFDEARKAGDTTVIENEGTNCYYVVAFEKRYLDQTPTADARIILTSDGNGQEIFDEWKNGEATEDSFAAIADQYNSDATAVEGGLYEGLTSAGLPEDLTSWLFDEARKAGDTTIVEDEDLGTTYVVYYVGKNAAQWSMSIKETLLADIMADYVEEIKAEIQVEDKKGKLNYLKVQAEEEAAAAEEGEPEESAEADDSAETGTEE